MVTRRDFIKKSGLAIAAAAMSGSPLKAMMGNNGQGSGASAAADGYVCQRPKPEERHFTSKAVEEDRRNEKEIERSETGLDV